MTAAPVAQLDVNQMAVGGSARETPVAGTLTAMFRQVCERFSDRAALTCGGETMTYAELDEASDRVAAGLYAAGVRQGDRVAMLMERSADLIVAMLAVLKAGAAYLPIDPQYPAARVAQTLNDAKPALVLVSEGTPHAGICLTELAGSSQVDAVHAVADDLAYVIYTSGSTGIPKGVEVTHGNVCALLQAGQELFHFDDHDVWTMFHSVAFDFSVWEIWGCLLSGGRLVMVPFEVSRSPDDFRALLAGEGVTVLNQTPSAFALLDRADAIAAGGPLQLRLILFGGEALNGLMLQAWMGRHGDSHPQLVNLYGITETTVHVTHRRMRLDDADETESLVGDAIPGWHVHVLDEHLGPVAEGLEGELCVSGAGVAKGYLRRPELTAERFVRNPFGPGQLYRSGDMARVRADGELVYLGRRDGQVKVNGFRIETAEVEAALLACAGVQQACATVRHGRLIAYIVSQSTVEASSLGAALAAQLPVHMLPALYVPVSHIPVNGNGKADRAALPDPSYRSVSPTPSAGNGKGSAMEKLVGAVWFEVLGTDVSYDDNFFDVGGTSVLLVAVRAGLSAQLGRAIPVTALFEATTIRTLARRLEGGAQAAQPAATARAEQQRQAFARARAAQEAKGAAR